MNLRRYTPLVFLFPGRFVEPEALPSGFDVEDWSEYEYRWIQDPWNGFRDFAKRPPETVAAGRGDCEDYALVAASWAVREGRSGVGLGFCFPPRSPVPRHVVAYDDERVYSIGDVERTSPGDWLAESRYARMLRRSVG